MSESNYAFTSWGQLFRDLTVPSGQLCQVRTPGVQHLVAAGVIDNVDTISSMVDKKHLKRVSGKAREEAERNGTLAPDGTVVDAAGMMKDPESLIRVFALIDKICCHMVVQPKVIPVPTEDSDEKRRPAEEIMAEGMVYVDMIDTMDKMFIFQYAVGGSSDLDQFRKQLHPTVGGVASQ